METIGQRRAHCSGSINLVILKADILSALSLVGTATTIEELKQANRAYEKALSTARNMVQPLSLDILSAGEYGAKLAHSGYLKNRVSSYQ